MKLILDGTLLFMKEKINRYSGTPYNYKKCQKFLFWHKSPILAYFSPRPRHQIYRILAKKRIMAEEKTIKYGSKEIDFF